MIKNQILLAADGGNGNGNAADKAADPASPAPKPGMVKVRNIMGQPILIDGIHLPAAETSKGRVIVAAPAVEVMAKHRARLGDFVEDVK